MGKKISRTVPITEVECLLCDTKEEGVVTLSLELHGTFKTDKALERAVRKTIETTPYVLLKIKGAKSYNAKCSMDTEDFITHATKIDFDDSMNHQTDPYERRKCKWVREFQEQCL